MLKPELDLTIRHARARDGVRIAYWATGSGEPLIYMPTIYSNVESDWRTIRGKAYAALAEHHRLIRYDGRGQGISDREPADLSLDAVVADLEAVIDDLGLRRVTLFAPGIAAAAAIPYAARHPDRVARLILWMPFINYKDYFSSSIRDALPLIGTNWDLFSMTASHMIIGWSRANEAQSAAQLLKESVSQEFFLRVLQAAPELDATNYQQRVRVPTLIMSRRPYDAYDNQHAVTMAAAIPSATLELLDGNESIIWDERREALRVVERFLGVSPSTHRGTLPDYLHNRSHDLSPREVDVLSFLAEGRRNKEIAADLGLSVYTVARHVATIYAKIGAHGRAEATRYAIEHGILRQRGVAAL